MTCRAGIGPPETIRSSTGRMIRALSASVAGSAVGACQVQELVDGFVRDAAGVSSDGGRSCAEGD